MTDAYKWKYLNGLKKIYRVSDKKILGYVASSQNDSYEAYITIKNEVTNEDKMIGEYISLKDASVALLKFIISAGNLI